MTRSRTGSVASLHADEPPRPVGAPSPRPVRRPALGFDEDHGATTSGTVARLREERRRQALLHAEQARAAAARPGTGMRAATVIAVLALVALVVVLALAG